MKIPSTKHLLALAITLGIAAACTPSPRNTPCSNQADCESADPEFRYCLDNRCVECVSDSSCGYGNVCRDGLCDRSCKDTRDCPDGQSCSGGHCSR